MSRLTKKDEGSDFYHYPKCIEMCNGEGCSEKCNDCPTEDSIIDKLGAYEDLEEQGLLPRFHLGDEFWALRLGRVVKAKVVMLQQKKDGTWKYRFSLEISSTYHDTVDYEQIEYGKYFWSTKEQAEQKLESMRGGESC